MVSTSKETCNRSKLPVACLKSAKVYRLVFTLSGLCLMSHVSPAVVRERGTDGRIGYREGHEEQRISCPAAGCGNQGAVYLLKFGVPSGLVGNLHTC